MAVQSDDNINLETLPASELKRKHWKYVGYRGFCEFVTSDDDFFILRRFSQLTARVLLALQDELTELESQLSILETQLSSRSAPDMHNGSFREETSQTRLDIIQEIDKKLRAYNELVLQHSELRSRPRVPRKDIASLSHWFHDHPNAIHASETEYINNTRDLFTVVPKLSSSLRQLLKRSPFLRLLLGKKPHIIDENIHYLSDQRIDFFIAMIMTTLGLAMLIAPLWWLAFVGHTTKRLGIITGFVVVFLCFVTFATNARTSESLGATAGYAAVLVVFLQISPSS